MAWWHNLRSPHQLCYLSKSRKGTDLRFLSGSERDEGDPDEEYCSTLRTRSVADLGLGDEREDSASPEASVIEAVTGPCPNGEKLELAMSTTRRLSSVILNLCFTLKISLFTLHNSHLKKSMQVHCKSCVCYCSPFYSSWLAGLAGQALTQASLFHSAQQS